MSADPPYQDIPAERGLKVLPAISSLLLEPDHNISSCFVCFLIVYCF